MKNLWTELDKALITEDGKVRHYLNDSEVHDFEVGDVCSLNYPNGYGHGSRVFHGICPTIPTSCGGGHPPKILEERNGYTKAGKKRTAACGVCKNGDVPDTASGDGSGGGNTPYIIQEKKNMEKAIRKITPKEALRLMGIRDEDAEKALAVNSDSQCYKQAGNAIVVPCLMAIFSQMGIEGVEKWNDKSEERLQEDAYELKW